MVEESLAEVIRAFDDEVAQVVSSRVDVEHFPRGRLLSITHKKAAGQGLPELRRSPVGGACKLVLLRKSIAGRNWLHAHHGT